MSDPVGIQWAIGRANELYMAGKIERDQIEEFARHFIEMRNRIDGATPPFTQSQAPQQQRQGNGGGQGQTIGFAPKKPDKKMSQRDFFERVLKAAGASGIETASASAYAEAALTRKYISEVIDQLQDETRRGEVARELLQRAEMWEQTQGGTPADTAGLA